MILIENIYEHIFKYLIFIERCKLRYINKMFNNILNRYKHKEIVNINIEKTKIINKNRNIKFNLNIYYAKLNNIIKKKDLINLYKLSIYTNSINNINFIKNIKELRLYSCNKITRIPVLNKLKKAHVSYCNNLEYIEELRNCEKVILSSCVSLMDIRSLKNVYDLSLKFSYNITNFYTLDNVRILNVSSTNIEEYELKYFKNVINLNISDCKNIRSISNLKKLDIKTLIISSNRINYIPIIESVTKLIYRYPKTWLLDLSNIIKMKNLNYLDLTEYTGENLTNQLKYLSNIYRLNLSYSHVRNISNLKNVRILDLTYNIYITEIPRLPNLKELILSYCLNLEDIDNLDNINKLDIRGCRKIKWDQLYKIKNIKKLLFNHYC